MRRRLRQSTQPHPVAAGRSRASTAAATVVSLSNVMRGLPVAALLIDGKRVVTANASAQRLFGQSQNRLGDRLTSDLFETEARDQIVRDDGSVRWVNTYVSSLRVSPSTLRVMLLMDVTDLKTSARELRASQARLKRMAVSRQALEGEMRHRIASELHAEIQQSLGAIHMEVGAQALASPRRDDMRPTLDRVSRIALTALHSTRRIVEDLEPLMLNDLGLAAALEMLVGGFSRRTGLHTSFRAIGFGGESDDMTPSTSVCLFGVAREALAQMARVANATRVDVLLSRDAGSVNLSARFDRIGRRDDTTPPANELWLLQLRECLALSGGTLTVDGSDGGTMTLTATIAASTATSRAQSSTPAKRQGHDPAYGQLVDFFYRMPVGVLQADLDGWVDLMNPRAAQILRHVVQEARIDNLFDCFSTCAPLLKSWVRECVQPTSTVCEQLIISLPPRPLGKTSAPSASVVLSVYKQRGDRLMAILDQPGTGALVTVG